MSSAIGSHGRQSSIEWPAEVFRKGVRSNVAGFETSHGL